MSETCLNRADYFVSVGRKIRQLTRWLQRGTGAMAHLSAKALVFQFRRGVLIDTIKYAVPDGEYTVKNFSVNLQYFFGKFVSNQIMFFYSQTVIMK